MLDVVSLPSNERVALAFLGFLAGIEMARRKLHLHRTKGSQYTYVV